MAETPNHGYNVPEEGTQDWHEPLNQNFEAFEVDIELRDAGDPGANGYDPAEGAKYLDTDTGTVYLGDGSSWTEAFSFGGGGDGSGTSLTGGNGIDPDSIGDGDTLSVAPAGIAGTALEADGTNLAVSSGGIGSTELASGAVTSTELSDGSISAADIGQNGASDGHVLRWNGSAWETGFPGTTGSSAVFELEAGGDTLLQLDPNDTSDPNVVIGTGHTVSSRGVTVGGGFGNEASGVSATVGGGQSNTAEAGFATIAGGGPTDTNNPDATKNVVHDDYGSIGGGGNNQAGSNDGSTTTAKHATVGGGLSNTASALNATVGGGSINTASGQNATVSGGTSNTASAGAAIGGGDSNTAGDSFATIAGGSGNSISAPEGTIGGGSGNTVSTGGGTVGGGRNNEASQLSTVGGGDTNTASGTYATVPGGTQNTASGSFSLAAGYRAKAVDRGSFVWADQAPADISSTGNDQFIVWANGGTGIMTNDPVTTFHVQDSVAESGGENLGRHVAAIENTSSSSSPVPDVLGLELTNVTEPNRFNSYISFMDSTGTIGNIQGDGNGGVEFTGSTADFAEFFLKANPEQEFTDGTVVGLDAGEVVALDAESEPDTVLVVSTAPLVTGNRPIDEGERDAYVKLSLVGQVPVRVSASVGHGDVLVADDDGTAIPRPDCAEAGRPVVGMALAEAEAGEEVLALVGGPGIDTTPASGGTSGTAGQDPADGDAGTGARTASVDERDRVDELEAELDKKAERIADLEAETDSLREENARVRETNEQLREQNADLEARLAAVEKRLAALDSGGATPASTDD